MPQPALRRSLLLFASTLTLGSSAPITAGTSLDVGVKIPVYDEIGLARSNELVKVLMPFADDAGIFTTNQVLIRDPGGGEVPVQWRVLVRWNGGPYDASRPIRFALAQFQATLTAGQSLQYTAWRRKPADGLPATPSSPIKLTATAGGAVIIDTGPMKASITPFTSNLFHKVSVDLDGDGIVEADETVIDGGCVGAGLIDPFGVPYMGRLDPKVKWVLEEFGPLKLVFRADYGHMPVVGGIGRDYLRSATRYTFEAGSAAVRIEQILKNAYLDDPLGAVNFQRYLVHARLAEPATTVTFGREEDTLTTTTVNLGQIPAAFQYQDSSGKSTWKQADTTFMGWRIYAGAANDLATLLPSLPTTTPIAEGLQAAGWMDVRDASRGLMVTVRYPWQNYPLALRASKDGDVIVDLLPSESTQTYWLDDAQCKSHFLTYRFHGGDFNPATEARRLANPLHPVVELDYLRATRTWGDQGDLRDPQLTFSVMQDNAAQRYYEYMIKVKDAQGFGWSDWGENVNAKSTHATGSPRNKLTYFDRYVTSGVRDWFRMQEAFVLHSMTLRTYHIDGFLQKEHPGAHLVEGIPHWSGSDKLGRDTIPTWLDAYRVGIPAGGHGWNGFDSEHMVADDLYEYYLLTGSYSALDAMRKMGEAMKTWHIINPNQPIVSSRAIGWSLRTLMKLYQVTGDPVLLQKARDLVQIVHTFRGQTPSPKTGIVYHYVARQIYGGGTHGMTEDYDLPWQMAVALYGLGLYYHETKDPTVPEVIHDVARYITDYCVDQNIVVDALACDDHTDFNPKWSNDGVNAWIPSALGMAYRMVPDVVILDLGKHLFEWNKSTFLNSGYYSWLHTIGEVVETGN